MPELIDISDIQSVTKLNGLVEPRKLDAWIVEAQLRLEKVLGRTLYTELKTAFDADNTLSGTANEKWRNLMEHGKGFAKDYLCWHALELAYPTLNAEAERAGVFTKKDDKLQNVSDRGLSALQAGARGCAEARLERLIEYLCANASTYPSYRTNTTGEERIDGTQLSKNGLVIRKSQRQTSYRG